MPLIDQFYRRSSSWLFIRKSKKLIEYEGRFPLFMLNIRKWSAGLLFEYGELQWRHIFLSPIQFRCPDYRLIV